MLQPFAVALIAWSALTALPAHSAEVAAAPAQQFLPPNVRLPASGDLVVLVPNPDNGAAAAKGQAIAAAELGRQLAAAGIRSSVLEEDNFKKIWDDSLQDLGGLRDAATGRVVPERLGKALVNLARVVCEQAQCSHIIEYRILTRATQLNGSSIQWDGVSRRMPAGRGGDRAALNGALPGLSLGLLGLTAGGDVAFRTIGGISVAFELDPAARKVRLRADPFTDPREITEGVAIALKPLLAGVPK